jgi:putative hydroxymethylpyrimidine transport system ATP-binding protein
VSSCPSLHVENLALHYGGQVIFENLTFEIPAGQCTALLGPSGVGKTSLLRIIAGLETPFAGAVTASDGAPLTGRIAYMAQQDFLLPWLSVLGNVMLGSRLRGETADPVRATNLLERVGLAERALALPGELSGGMRQRVALARTLYEQRPVVLMDEPFSALDAITRTKVQNLAAELLAGCTTLLITHDPLEACRLSHHLLVLAGAPARLGLPITVPGNPPRPPDDFLLLQTQAELLRRLAL